MRANDAGGGDASGNIVVFLFGGMRMRLGNRTISRFRTQKTASLLAYLALHAGRSYAREVLVEMFWPGDGNGRMSLSGALSSLRQQLEPPNVAAPGSALVTDRMNVGLAAETVSTDVARFERLLTLAQTAERHQDHERRLELLTEAVRLYDQNDAGAPGGMLPGFYDEWVIPEQERLAGLYARALQSLALLQEDQNEPGEALASLRRIALLNSWDEDVTAEIRRLQTRATIPVLKPAAFATAPSSGDGRRAAAQPAVSRTATIAQPVLQAERTAHALLAPSLPDPFEPSGFPLPLPLTRFFGRESDLMHLRWAMGTGAQRLITLVGPGGVGKTRLALEVARLLQEDDAEGGQSPERRVFYAPLAGVATAADLPGALMTIIGDALPNMALVTAASVGAPAAQTSRQPEKLRPTRNDPQASLVDVLRRLPFPCVLVLDNFEHLADEGGPFIESLLQQVPRLSCLVTSRLKIGVSGEKSYPVTPLLASTPPRAAWSQVLGAEETSDADWSPASDPLTSGSPSPDEQNPLASLLQDDPALALFVDRAQATRTDFQLTHRNAASVCALVARLEGIPLALELAAARVSLLTPQQMLDELTKHRFDLLVNRRPGRPVLNPSGAGGDANDPVRARHRSLWDTIAWSYRLLPADVQAVWTRLSVFRGGWTVEAAQAVCAPLYERRGRGGGYLLDDIAYLCDASLVQAVEVVSSSGSPSERSEMRFSMLETLRDFGSEQADAESDASENARRRHAGYFLGVAEAESARLQGKEQAHALARLASERDNLRAALLWAEGSQTEDAARLHLALATALHGYFLIRGPLATGRAHLDVALLRLGAFAKGIVPQSAVADALSAAGVLALRQGDVSTAETRFKECLRVRCEQMDLRGMAKAQNNLAVIYSQQGDFAGAQEFYTESLARWRDLGETRNIAIVLANLGAISLVQNEWDDAKLLLTESLTLSRALGDTRSQADTLRNLGELAQRCGNHFDACQRYQETLPLLEELEDCIGVACSLLNFGFAVAPEDFALSNFVIGSALAQYEAQGVALTPEWKAELERQTTASHEALGVKATEAARRQGASEPLTHVIQATIRGRK